MSGGDSAGKDAELIAAWIAGHETWDGTRPDLFWAYETLDKICRNEPERCLAVLEGIVAASESEIVLANLAAGPVENLLVRHGSAVVDSIVGRARADARWRKVLGAVWRNNMDDAVWEEIRRVAGPSW